MYVRASTIKNLVQDPAVKLKSIMMCLLKEFCIKDHKTIRADAFNEFSESNNDFFEVTRSLLGLDDVSNEDAFGNNML